MRVYFKAGDHLQISKHNSDPGKGLSYPTCLVEALEDGCSGGWDVWDALDMNGEEISFYGFSVEKKVRE